MTLSAGTRLGGYEVVALIGAGGMGEVYRARDTTLNRDVALKVLPESVAADPDRLSRFRREATVLASLNHLNIAHIYGFEEAGATHAIAMELVDGLTLEEMIRSPGPRPQVPGPSSGPGALPLSDALPIARQIAEALEAAHDQGIVHRDLKPANVKVRDDGLVKVLDFGLAKALDPAAGSGVADLANSPTLTARSTQLGMILGTAAYMAPEQARGRAVDRRADIWAFGAVLYEMLTAKRAFEGDDVSTTLAAVLKDDVDWAALPATVPAPLQRLLHRCLERDPKRRLQAIGEARVVIDDLLSGSATDKPASAAPADSRPSARLWIAAAAGVLAGVAVTTAVVWLATRNTPAAPSPSARFMFAPSATQPLRLSPFDRMIAISPDGSHIVAQIASADHPLSVRAIDQLDAVALAGTEGARWPFISPDGKWIGYFRGTAEIRKIGISGGPSTLICKVTGGGPRGAVWGPDDTIVFATVDPTTGLLSVPASGGEPKVLTRPDNAHGELDHLFPSLLPGGRGILFTIASSAQLESSQIAVFDLRTGRYKTLIRGGSQPAFVGAPDRRDGAGYLVYGAGGSLRAVRFDLDRLETSGESVPVLDHVAMVSSGAAEFSASDSGSLAYVPGTLSTAEALSLAWVDRQGKSSPVNAPPRAYYALAWSPDGGRIALDIRDQENDLWTWDVVRQTLTRLTFDPSADGIPVWSPDGRRIAFGSQRKGPYNVYVQAADGTGTTERLLVTSQSQLPTSFSADGRQLVVQELGVGLGLATIGSSDAPKPLLHQQSESRNGVISPDGRFIAYESNESGHFEVYVRPFPNVDGGKWQISRAGGVKPAWSARSHELFYIALPEEALMAVSTQTAPAFSAGNPVKLFGAANVSGLIYGRHYDVSPDGQRFILITDPGAQENTKVPAPSIVVVTNWFDELKTKMGNR